MSSTVLDKWLQFCAENGFTKPILAESGFTKFENNRVWVRKNHSGIYVWLHEDGDAYCGKSNNLINRLREHRKDYEGRIVCAAVRYCGNANLDLLEQKMISNLETYLPIINVLHSLKTTTLRPYDLVVQDHMPTPNSYTGDFECLRRRSRFKYEKAEKVGGYQIMLDCLERYINIAIPNFWATEYQFWSLTILSATRWRLNCGNQEIMTIEMFEGELEVRVLTSKALSQYSYQTSYVSKMFCTHFTVAEFFHCSFNQSLKEAAVRMMRTTSAINKASHCPQLVRASMNFR